MRIVVAKTAGFCMGVRRAVDVALEETANHSEGLHTLGPLIHNAQTLELLHKRGARIHDEDAPLAGPSRVMIRAHGVRPEVQASYERAGHTIIDGTCPKVKTVHKVIERYRGNGYDIVISGDEGHAEVIGLLAYAGERGRLVQNESDVDQLPAELAKICLVSQTTFDRTLFEKIATRLRERFPEAEVVVKRTICSATQQRQEETRELAKRVDAMVVVGGKNSANTQRLASIARESGALTQHVETECEIDSAQLASCQTVGVTAGASTPHWMIQRVVDQLHENARTDKRSLKGLALSTLDVLGYLNMFVAMGAAAVYYASSRLQGLPFQPTGAALAFFYFLAMHLWNSLASAEMTQHLGIGRYRFYSAHRVLLFSVSGASLLALLVMCWMVGPLLFYLMLFATVAGSLYHITIVPRFLERVLRYRNLKDIPMSRDLFVALAWAVVLTFVPQSMNDTFAAGLPNIFCFGWVFFLAFIRSLVFDLRDIQGDRIMGRETLITLIGERNARRFTIGLLQLALAAIVVYSLTLVITQRELGRNSIVFLAQTPALLYIHGLISMRERLFSVRHPSHFNVMVDGQFYIAAFMAWLAPLFVG